MVGGKKRIIRVREPRAGLDEFYVFVNTDDAYETEAATNLRNIFSIVLTDLTFNTNNDGRLGPFKLWDIANHILALITGYRDYAQSKSNKQQIHLGFSEWLMVHQDRKLAWMKNRLELAKRKKIQ